MAYWEQTIQYLTDHGPAISHIHIEEADGYSEESHISFRIIQNGRIEYLEISAYGDAGQWKLHRDSVDDLAHAVEYISGNTVHPEPRIDLGGAEFRLEDPGDVDFRYPSEVLDHLFSVQRFWQAADFDGNGRPDSWNRDIAGLFGTERDGRPVGLIHQRIAQADMAPNRAFRSVGRTGIPLNGFLYRVMDIDAEGLEYADTGRLAYCAVPSPYNPMDEDSRYTIIYDNDHEWYKDTGGQPVLRWPTDPVAEGWE
jgi:hypothetical protein